MFGMTNDCDKGYCLGQEPSLGEDASGSWLHNRTLAGEEKWFD